MGYNLNVEAIFEDDPLMNLPLMKVIVAELDGPKQDINKIFKLADTNSLPVGQLKHLRRVRNTDVGKIECILCEIGPVEDSEDRFLIDERKLIDTVRDVFERERVLLRNHRIIEVPSRVARTDDQLKAYSKIWPTKFAKSDYLNKCVEGSIIDDKERLVVQVLTNALIEYLEERDCKFTSGAVIFRCAKIYGVGLSSCATIQENPTKHSPMIAIDSVAKNACAGHWPADMHSSGDNLLSRLHQELDNRPELVDHKLDPNFMPYICTNYDILMTEEPCMMCTMGLIQSRIRRLFYLNINNQNTSIRSLKPICYEDHAIEQSFIHRHKNINHRFEAWRIKLLPTA